MSETHESRRTPPTRDGRPLTRFTPPAVPAPRELPGHAPRSEATVHGRASVLVGVLPMLVGTLLLAAVTGAFGDLSAAARAPGWIAAVFAVVCFLAGLAFVAHGWHGVSRARRVRRLRAHHPREPWLWDHPWNAYAAFDGTRRELRRAVTMVAVLALFLAPFHWIAWGGPRVEWGFAGVTLLFDLALAAVALKAAHLAARLRRYGRTELRLPCFPCTLGDEIELRLVRTPALAAIGRLRGTLRCIQERYETRGAGKSRRQVVVAYLLHEQATEGEEARTGECVRFRFTLPAEAAGTALAERPPRYWELRIEGEAPGVDYDATFLLPIYAPER